MVQLVKKFFPWKTRTRLYCISNARAADDLAMIKNVFPHLSGANELKWRFVKPIMLLASNCVAQPRHISPQSVIGHHLYSWWIVAKSAPSQYVTNCGIISWPLRNTPRNELWIRTEFDQNTIENIIKGRPSLQASSSWDVQRAIASPDILERYQAITWTNVDTPLMRSCDHYSDVIMSAMASQITIVSFVCSTVCSGADQRKHQSSASLAFMGGIHRWPENSLHKRPVTRKMFPFDDAIMYEIPWKSLQCNVYLNTQAISPMLCLRFAHLKSQPHLQELVTLHIRLSIVIHGSVRWGV